MSELERTYDPERLKRLLEGWDLEDFQVAHKVDDSAWVTERGNFTSPGPGSHVAMVTARRSA